MDWQIVTGPTDFFHGVPSWVTNLARVSRGRCVRLEEGTASGVSLLQRAAFVMLVRVCVKLYLRSVVTIGTIHTVNMCTSHT